MQTRNVDIVIIGAGPAGLATALNLVAYDPFWTQPIVVLEQGQHPREKLCGGGLSGRVSAHLDQLDLTLDVSTAVVDTAHMVFEGRSVSIRASPAFRVARRAEFDAWLCRIPMGVSNHL